jgi:hypothetical protein
MYRVQQKNIRQHALIHSLHFVVYTKKFFKNIWNELPQQPINKSVLTSVIHKEYKLVHQSRRLTF